MNCPLMYRVGVGVFGPILRGEHISLEPPRDEDIDLYCSWFADTDLTRYLLVRFPPSPEGEVEWLRNAAANQHAVQWRIVLEGRTIGSTALHDIDWKNRHATTGTVIGDRSVWGKGYGSESVRLRTAYAFNELGLERLETQSMAENVGMHRALERAGYQRIAVRRRFAFFEGCWHDSYLFELLRDEWVATQEAPR
jgi:RimJ/RimL family protein N-acetyltransferase